MKAKSKNVYQVIQLTEAMRAEQDQKTVRSYFDSITSVEVRSGSLAVSTRTTRYDIPVGAWIMKNQRGTVTIIPDITFKMNYELIDD